VDRGQPYGNKGEIRLCQVVSAIEDKMKKWGDIFVLDRLFGGINKICANTLVITNVVNHLLSNCYYMHLSHMTSDGKVSVFG
jgi:hypothetical protein